MHDLFTIGRLRHSNNLAGSDFLRAYSDFMGGRFPEVDDRSLLLLLRTAVLMLASEDHLVNQLGYRIVLNYSIESGDLDPLYQIAAAKEYYPITAVIEALRPGDDRDELAATLLQAHRTNYESAFGDRRIVRTRGQKELQEFAERNSSAVLVAPTSYGKSELLVHRVVASLGRNVCVLVPTRALISQTRRLLMSDQRIRASKTRILTHPDTYRPGEAFVAVLTQERLTRLLVSNSGASVDVLLVDEAHNLLTNDARAHMTSQVIMIARHRNPDLETAYFTPFVSDPSSLASIGERELKGSTVDEHVKIERIYVADPVSGNLSLYDQFLDEFIEAAAIATNEIDAVVGQAGDRNLLYVNRPRDAERLARQLKGRLPKTGWAKGAKAAHAIADLIDPEYGLIDGIKHGVLFHHGSVPDILRQYVEDLFNDSGHDSPLYLVCTSTLLEGVNTPADRLFLMSPRRGQGNLSRSAFKNLIGRVARFKEVFGSDRARLDLLQPRIYVMKSSYSPANFNPQRFVRAVGDARKKTTDEVRNPLMIRSERTDLRHSLLEHLENVEPGSTDLVGARRVGTTVGSLLYRNNIRDFDVYRHEAQIEGQVGRRTLAPVASVDDVLPTIAEVFWANTDLSNAPELERVRDNHQAMDFYRMFLRWKANGAPYKVMVRNFLRYWEGLQDELVYVGTTWGEVSDGEHGYRKPFVRIAEKPASERVNLAVVKVKEEQDFVELRLMPYVETLRELGLIDDALYNALRYGTNDRTIICLLKFGVSPELARLLRDGYSDFFSINFDSEEVLIAPDLVAAMDRNGENDILIYEAEILSA